MKVIIFVLLLALLTGGALGGAAYMKIGPFEEKKVETPLVDVTETPIFLDMDTLMIPVIDGKVVRKQIFVQVQLEVIRPHDMEVVRTMPRLHSAFLIELNQFLPGHLRDRPTPNLSVMKARLQNVANKVVGSGKVANVLVKSAYER